jgi:hypothetical protein
MTEYDDYAQWEKDRKRLLDKSVASGTAEANRLGEKAKPFLDAFAKALDASTVELEPNSHVWRVVLFGGNLVIANNADADSMAWICTVGQHGELDKPEAISAIHKALGIKVAEKSSAFATFVSTRMFFLLLDRVWAIRSLMPQHVDTILVYSAEWFRKVTLASAGHFKFAADRDQNKRPKI